MAKGKSKLKDYIVMRTVRAEPCYEQDYLDFKVCVLNQIGLHSIQKTKAYMAEHSKNSTTEEQRIVRIDNAARKLMMDFYDGDQTYVPYEWPMPS